MIQIAICDEGRNMRASLSSLVRKLNTECEITEYVSGDEYLSDGKDYDILFSGIQMQPTSGSMDGMTLARTIRSMPLHKQPVIIFIADSEKYVYEAFDVDAFQYLLKPLDEGRFSTVLQRAVKKITDNSLERKKVLVVQHAKSSKMIPLENIYYIESASHKVVLHMKEGEELEYYARIGDLETELRGQFYRIHRGYLIHIACVDEYTRTDVTMVNGDKLLISKYKYSGFVQAYQEYIARQKDLYPRA